VREFTREPEAVFWALFFPILITAGLGVAFRSRPAEVLKIAVAGPELARAARQAPGLDVTETDVATGEQLLRTGKVALVVEPGMIPALCSATTTRIPRDARLGCSLMMRSSVARDGAIRWRPRAR
jgi:hypothetical protein